MRTGLITKKLGMSSMFTDQGERITLTFLKLEDCLVVGQKTMDRDGYNALVLGAILRKVSRVSKPMKAIFANAKIEPRAKLKEFRVSDSNMLAIGSELKPSHYEIGQYVDVSSRSIGKGFAGVMKRHNFAGLEATHGVSISHRSHGSTGQCQDPGKVFKGKKMAGHMGDKNITIQNLQVVEIDDVNGVIVVSGNVPGSKGGYVFIKDAVKKSVAA
ncbi:MAG: 50S ribosomal protein L3 [Rickettsiales bacterium]|nr:MAG: 50S ribosomal protein L3 [Rickettsiales bacterium]